MKRIGLIGLDSSHAEDFLRLFNTELRHPGLRITAVYGGTTERQAELRALAPDIVSAETVGSLVVAVDAVIVGDRDGARHLQHALPAIAAGLPTFIDKPLANSLADGSAIVAAARQSGATILSGSALRWQTETQRLKARIAHLDAPAELVVQGTWFPDSPFGGPIFYAIHAVELALELLGNEFSAVVRATEEAHAVRYRAGEHTVTLAFRAPQADGSAAFGVSLRSGTTTAERAITLDDDYMAPVCAEISQLIIAGKRALSDAALLAPLGLMGAITAELHQDR